MPQFLILRREDLIHIGLQWSDFRFDKGEVPPGIRPQLVAMSDKARITLTFPPQVLSERAMTSRVLPALSSISTRRSGTSRVQFAVPAGTAMELNVESILGALRGPGVRVVSRGVAAPATTCPVTPGLGTKWTCPEHLDIISSVLRICPRGDQSLVPREFSCPNHRFICSSSPGSCPIDGVSLELTVFLPEPPPSPPVPPEQREPTSIEIPWKLIVSVLPRNESPIGPEATVVSDHAVLPLTSTSEVTGLWHARLQASDGDAEDAGLWLLPLHAEPGDMDPPTTLDIIRRTKIVEQSRANGLPRTKRLELSTLGGSLSVTAKWPTFEWDHDVMMGRDRRIRVVEAGTLYPFGHRAQLDTFTEREFCTLEAPEPTGPVTSVIVVKWTCPRHPDLVFDGPGLHGTDELVERIFTCRKHRDIVRFDPGFCPLDGSRLELEGLLPDPEPEPDRPSVAAAGLRSRTKLVIKEPVLKGMLTRNFPFDEVEILAHSFEIIDSSQDFFVPLDRKTGEPLLFPLRFAGADGDVFFSVPLVFVKSGRPLREQDIANLWEPYSAIKLPGVPIDMIHSPHGRAAGDVHEVHELKISAISPEGIFRRPMISQFTAELPALRELLHKPSVREAFEYTPDFLNSAEDVDIAFKPAKPILIDFTDQPGSSGGLMAPRFEANKLSRTLGPIPLPETNDPLETYKDATLLGLPLGSLIKEGQGPPSIIPILGNPPGTKMTWNLILKNHGPFRADDSTKATLTVERSPAKNEIMCAVKNFSFVLPTDEPLVRLEFGSLVFTQKPEHAPDLQINGITINFDGAMQLLQEVLVILNPLMGDNRPTINATPSGISADYMLGLPSVPAGAFLIRNLAIHFGVDVPFSQKPVTLSLGFARRDNPFNLSVLMFGGGGYIDVQIGPTGLTRFEASMEFGAVIAIDFIIAKAEVHAFGGVRFVTAGGIPELEAFIRIGGSIEVFGLVSVSIELRVALRYEDGCLVGQATLVIEVDLTLFSESVTIPSPKYELCGGNRSSRTRGIISGRLDDMDSRLTNLQEYYEAFVQ